MQPFLPETIENWVSDFRISDAARGFSAAAQDHIDAILTRFLVAACEARGVEPSEVEEPDLKTALLDDVARLDLPAPVRAEVPRLCAAFLEQLEREGRLSGGRVLGAYVAALSDAFKQAASGKLQPIVNPGSKLGRNDPCPCGSGRKFKKCCMQN